MSQTEHEPMNQIKATQAHVELVEDVLWNQSDEWYDIELDEDAGVIHLWMNRGLVNPERFEDRGLKVGWVSCGPTAGEEYTAHVPITPTEEVSDE